MSTVYHTFSVPSFPLQSTFEKRWSHVELLLRLHFVARNDDVHLDALLQDAQQHLWKIYATETELLTVSSDAQWVQTALQGVLRIDENQSQFNQQFEIIERRLHHWARQHFKAELVEDIVQSAFIKLWDDYQRHQHEWDTKPESFWVSSGKLAMKSAARDLRSQTQHRKGSSRRHEPCEWITHMLSEHEFTAFHDDDEQNDLLDLLSQNSDLDIHGKETQRANLRLDLEKLLKTVQAHYRPAIFERCLLVLERLSEGYTPAEIRLELGWTKVTYESTMTLIRRMSRFAEDYQRAPNRCTKMSEAEIARIHALRASGCTQPEIARLVGRHVKTVWAVTQRAAQA